MSATAERINLASDPMLPQRDLLLNAREVARRLSSRLGASGHLTIDACERIRTKYRVGSSLRVLHRVRVGTADFTIAARTFPKGRSEQAYKRALDITVNCEPLRAVVRDAELETVFWTFPNDRRIAGLQALTKIPPALSRAFIPAWTSSRVVAYAPEKCATAQCLDNELNVLAYAKVYQGDEGQRIFDVYEALRRELPAARTELCLPRALAYSEAHRMLLLEPIEGKRIADLYGLDMLHGYRRLGCALATLHSLPMPEGLPQSERLLVRRIEQAARIVAQARPDVQREAFGLADELSARWESQGDAPVCLHGDVHSKNGILRGDSFTLIDIDQAAAGNPAVDLGSLLASISYNRLSGLISLAVSQALGDAFLAGYASVRKLPPPTYMRWHTAAALLAERALRAVNRVRTEGLGCLRELLIEAKNILQPGGVG